VQEHHRLEGVAIPELHQAADVVLHAEILEIGDAQ